MCDSTDADCFVEFRDPKSPDDLTQGGRDLPDPSGSSDASATIYESDCPDDCCSSENCLRKRDILGYLVYPNQENLIIFGGVSLRNVAVDGELLYNSCTENIEKALELGYTVNFVEPCGQQLLNEIWRYNIDQDVWEYLKPTTNKRKTDTYSSPYPRFGHSAAYIETKQLDDATDTYVLRKYMYVYGGFALECKDACEDFWRFEIPWAAQRYYPQPEDVNVYWNRGNTWENMTKIVSPGPRTKHCMVSSQDNSYIYLFGGYGNQTFHNDLWRYDVSDDSWGTMQTFGILQVIRNIKLWNSTSFDIVIDESKRKISDDVVYSIEGSIPQIRTSASMIHFKGSEDYLLLFGGWGLKNQPYGNMTVGVALNDFWIYSIKSKKWTRIYPSNSGPSPRIESNMVQLDISRVSVYGGRRQETTFNDFWVFNLETNRWYNWTEDLFTQSQNFPKGRYRGNLINSSKGIVAYGGSYVNPTNLTYMDIIVADFKNYLSSCSLVLTIYDVSTSWLGDPDYDEFFEDLYNRTNNNCFLNTVEMPDIKKDVEVLQGVWFLNLYSCLNNCTGHGECIDSNCRCDIGYYGEYCQHLSCPGSLCIYDNEFFTVSECLHCSNNGACLNGTCSCNPGYQGDDCSIIDCLDGCELNGNCIQIYPISQCDCIGKRGGDSCDVVFCLNSCNEPNGDCNYTVGDCVCKQGFYGLDCSVHSIYSSSIYLALSLHILWIII